ncbi:MAG: hypothetical protein Kow0032_22250 [Methyloligellaceae bacterium]
MRIRLGVSAALLAGAVLSAALSGLSGAAAAEEKHKDSAIRLYFALPLGTGGETREPGRLGLQLLAENGDDMLYAPVPEDPEKFTAIDLGFSRNGLAKFDVNGEDMRDAYEAFARAIGLTPEEVELCRTADCLDWVKPGGANGLAAHAADAE